MILDVDSKAICLDDYIISVKSQQLYSIDPEVWRLSSYADIAGILQGESQPVYIYVGDYQEKRCYVVELDQVIGEKHLLPLRSQMSVLSELLYQLASRALQLLTWYKQHQFCGQCGRQTTNHKAELALTCTSCDNIFYPRISPCIMVLISRGDQFLLARHCRQSDDLYSTLAGFVEAGETLEHAVHREVFEEVGVKIKNICYSSSQSWPHPHQLMVGYFAEYDAGDIQVDGIEIADAQWFYYDDLPTIPAEETLSGQLIRDFIETVKSRQ